MKGRTAIPSGWKGQEQEEQPQPIVIEQPDFVFEPSLPQSPDYLVGEAREEWDRIIDEIADFNILHPVDKQVLAGYCKTFAQYRECCDIIDREGMVYRTGGLFNGVFRPIKIMPHPAVALSQMLLTQMLKISRQFGFTPGSRRYLGVVPKRDEVEQPEVVVDNTPKRPELLGFINGNGRNN